MEDNSFEDYEVADELNEGVTINKASHVVPYFRPIPFSQDSNKAHVYVRNQCENINNPGSQNVPVNIQVDLNKMLFL